MKSFLDKSNFSPKVISRLLGWNAKNDDSCAFCGADIRDMRHWNEVEKLLAYLFAVLYHELYKPQLFSRTEPAARVFCGVWYLTQETDAEPAVYSHGINSTRVPSPLAVSGTSRMGGKNHSHKPLRCFEAACTVHTYAF